MKLERRQFVNAYAKRSPYLMELVGRILEAAHPTVAQDAQFFKFKLGPRVGAPCCVAATITVPTNVGMESFVRSLLHEARHAWDYLHGHDLYLIPEEGEAVAEAFSRATVKHVYANALTDREKKGWRP